MAAASCGNHIAFQFVSVSFKLFAVNHELLLHGLRAHQVFLKHLHLIGLMRKEVFEGLLRVPQHLKLLQQLLIVIAEQAYFLLYSARLALLKSLKAAFQTFFHSFLVAHLSFQVLALVDQPKASLRTFGQVCVHLCLLKIGGSDELLHLTHESLLLCLNHLLTRVLLVERDKYLTGDLAQVRFNRLNAFLLPCER